MLAFLRADFGPGESVDGRASAMQGKCSPRTLNTSAAFIVHCAWGIFINLNTRFPFCIVVSFCPIPLIYKDFLLDPFQGPSLQVEILSVCLFVRPSSLLILFLIQTLSSRNLPQATLVTQPLTQYPMSPIHVSHARQSTGPQ